MDGAKQFGACARHEGSRDLPCGGCDARHVRDGRRAELLDLRGNHGAERELLPLHELRIYERVQLAG